MSKPRLAVHKFSSCDGCQLGILNLEEELLDLFPGSHQHHSTRTL